MGRGFVSCAEKNVDIGDQFLFCQIGDAIVSSLPPSRQVDVPGDVMWAVGCIFSCKG
jgi:hypothetical protein